MCRNIQLKLAMAGLLCGLGGVLSTMATPSPACPSTATQVGSGQSIGTFAQGSGINVSEGVLPDGVAPCQVITVQSTVKYAGVTTYAWTGTTATITAVAGTTEFATAESTTDVRPPNYTTTVLSDPANSSCVGVNSEDLLSFDYTPTAADIAAGGVTFVLQYTGVAESGGTGNVSGSASITVLIHSCDDNNPCTVDTCVPDTTGLAQCVHTPVSCDDNNACTTDTCDAALGCVNTAISCDDNNTCTTDSCDTVLGCQNVPISCDDSNACTIDSCDATAGCQHTAVVCDDNNACTSDTCDTTAGCVYTPITCNDNNACTQDSCDPSAGCTYTAITCNDNNACTTDTCDPATGCVYTAISCDDGNPCTVDTCNPSTGCVHSPNPNCQAGCTPGFWKNCTANWKCFTTGQLVSSVFTIPSQTSCPGLYSPVNVGSATLLQALGFNGGSGVNGAAQILIRAAVAALNNSCTSGPVSGYPFTTSSIISQVNSALASCDRTTILNLATTLDNDNNLGCNSSNGQAIPCNPKNK